MIEPHMPIRVARPVRDLRSSEDFYVRGLGLQLLYRSDGDAAVGERDLLMVGPAGGSWHLELTASSTETVEPSPTPEDLLVVYLGQPASEELVRRAVEHGGVVVKAHNPYWERWGVTLADPDGYRVVLSSRTWASGPTAGNAG